MALIRRGHFKLSIMESIKQKIVTACILGLITTGIMSFTLVAINAGFDDGFFAKWGKSWILSYVIVVPVILGVAPKVQGFVAGFFNSEKKEKC